MQIAYTLHPSTLGDSPTRSTSRDDIPGGREKACGGSIDVCPQVRDGDLLHYWRVRLPYTNRCIPGVTYDFVSFLVLACQYIGKMYLT